MLNVLKVVLYVMLLIVSWHADGCTLQRRVLQKIKVGHPALAVKIESSQPLSLGERQVLITYEKNELNLMATEVRSEFQRRSSTFAENNDQMILALSYMIDNEGVSAAEALDKATEFLPIGTRSIGKRPGYDIPLNWLLNGDHTVAINGQEVSESGLSIIKDRNPNWFISADIEAGSRFFEQSMSGRDADILLRSSEDIFSIKGQLSRLEQGDSGAVFFRKHKVVFSTGESMVVDVDSSLFVYSYGDGRLQVLNGVSAGRVIDIHEISLEELNRVFCENYYAKFIQARSQLPHTIDRLNYAIETNQPRLIERYTHIYMAENSVFLNELGFAYSEHLEVREVEGIDYLFIERR
jgi:hypothetical protein